jgi:hypothetical protein
MNSIIQNQEQHRGKHGSGRTLPSLNNLKAARSLEMLAEALCESNSGTNARKVRKRAHLAELEELEEGELRGEGLPAGHQVVGHQPHPLLRAAPHLHARVRNAPGGRERKVQNGLWEAFSLTRCSY